MHVNQPILVLIFFSFISHILLRVSLSFVHVKNYWSSSVVGLRQKLILNNKMESHCLHKFLRNHLSNNFIKNNSIYFVINVYTRHALVWFTFVPTAVAKIATDCIQIILFNIISIFFLLHSCVFHMLTFLFCFIPH